MSCCFLEVDFLKSKTYPLSHAFGLMERNASYFLGFRSNISITQKRILPNFYLFRY